MLQFLAHICLALVAAITLRCQDAPPTSLQQPPAQDGPWRVSESESPIDDSKTVTLSLDSTDEAHGWPDKKVRPTLIIRHKEGRLEMYVVTGLATHPEGGQMGRATATVRFDKAKALDVTMSTATSNDSLFFGRKNWIRSVLRHQKMVFRFTPYNSSPQTVSFNLTGVDKAIPHLESAIGWKFGSVEDRVAEELSLWASILATNAMGNMCDDAEGDQLDLSVELRASAMRSPSFFGLAVASLDKCLVADGMPLEVLPPSWKLRLVVNSKLLKETSRNPSEFLAEARKQATRDGVPDSRIELAETDTGAIAKFEVTGIPRGITRQW